MYIVNIFPMNGDITRLELKDDNEIIEILNTLDNLESVTIQKVEVSDENK